MSRLAYERAIRRSGLKPPSRHLALTIATWADIKTGRIPDRFQPSLTTLEEATGMTRKTVRTHLDLLEEAGWMGRARPTETAARRGERTHYRLLIPAGATVAEDDEGRGGDPLPPAEVGEEIPQGGGAHPLEVGEEIPPGRGGDPLKSPLSSGSTYQSPRAGAPEHDTDRSGDHHDGSTKKPTTIKSALDAAADAAREELGRATRREIRPEWARKVAMSILDAASRPISEGRHAAYVRTAIRKETDLSRFLPTPTASSSRLDEAFLPDPAEQAPAPPALTLHTTDKPRPRKGPAQPPLLAPVADQPPLPTELTDPITTGPTADTVRSYADQIRADLEARRASGEAQ